MLCEWTTMILIQTYLTNFEINITYYQSLLSLLLFAEYFFLFFLFFFNFFHFLLFSQSFLSSDILSSILFFLFVLYLFYMFFTFQMHSPVKLPVYFQFTSLTIKVFPLFERHWFVLCEMIFILDDMPESMGFDCFYYLHCSFSYLILESLKNIQSFSFFLL